MSASANLETPHEGPRLWLVGTPIGNLEDLPPRAARILGEVSVIACEDTRTTRRLLDLTGITPPRLIACHDHNEQSSAAGIVKLLEQGESVALVSDAGMPAISDPGYRVVRAVIEAGFEVSAVPGPSSVLMALAVSGLPTDRFTFLGFAPRKSGKRQRWLEPFVSDPATLIIMESTQRLAETLADAAQILGERQGAVAFELTKAFERVHRGTLGDLAARYGEPPLGEAVIVIAGAVVVREKVNKYTPDGGKKKRA
ncbi:MAG: 16S rRNA (cytidine(1402)-2'-O)-methyltransferase RsmI [Oceanicaulis sp. HLUCCA04]|nr:MAG: 16S rRNA (cytidine(1402)-2'-O)-methyltransferase RsmI [Oceanicaulis sp. HLUCCA04]